MEQHEYALTATIRSILLSGMASASEMSNLRAAADGMTGPDSVLALGALAMFEIEHAD